MVEVKTDNVSPKKALRALRQKMTKKGPVKDADGLRRLSNKRRLDHLHRKPGK